jgi:pimeloyl-ACP methyl ester carboxylesterase
VRPPDTAVARAAEGLCREDVGLGALRAHGSFLLVIWGEEDAWLAPEFGRRRVEAIPAALFTTVPNAGHFVPEDRPDDVARALARFFSSA